MGLTMNRPGGPEKYGASFGGAKKHGAILTPSGCKLLLLYALPESEIHFGMWANTYYCHSGVKCPENDFTDILSCHSR